MKKTLSVLLTLVMILSVITLGGTTTFAQDSLVRVPSTIPGTDTPYNYVENVTVKIPGTEVTFKMTGVAETVYKRLNSNFGFPEYFFLFYETNGSAIINQDGSWMAASLRDGYYGDGIAINYPNGKIFSHFNVFVEEEEIETKTVFFETNIFSNNSCEYSNDFAYGFNTSNNFPIAKTRFWFGNGTWNFPYEWLQACDKIDISELTVQDDATVNITEPSQTTINYKDGIVLNAETENIPNGAKVEWSADNDNFKLKKSDDNNTLTVISNKTGTTVFTATLYDADNNVLTEDTVELNSKAGFAQKISGFFKVLFGLTKIYDK